MQTVLNTEKELRALVIHDPDYKAFREKTTKMRVLGLRIPAIRQFISEHPITDRTLLNELWKNATFHETKIVALLSYLKLTLAKQDWNILKSWVDDVENWEHSDNLSYLYSKLFEQFPDHLLPTLRTWNKSKNPWKQRASIVSLIYYASPRRKAPPVALVFEMVEPLIVSNDAYVNKAVGWTLRESYTLSPKETFLFLKKHIRAFSAESFSYATERVTKKEKAELKMLRAKR